MLTPKHHRFVHDIFERIATEAGRLARYQKRSTITSREIQTAVRLILPGELAKHAVSEGTKAVCKYNASCAASSGGDTKKKKEEGEAEDEEDEDEEDTEGSEEDDDNDAASVASDDQEPKDDQQTPIQQQADETPKKKVLTYTAPV